jgi:hypothetical protein
MSKDKEDIFQQKIHRIHNTFTKIDDKIHVCPKEHINYDGSISVRFGITLNIGKYAETQIYVYPYTDNDSDYPVGIIFNSRYEGSELYIRSHEHICNSEYDIIQAFCELIGYHGV